MGFNYRLYELGKRSADRLVRSLRQALCGDPGKPCNELSELAPYLIGAEDCEDLRITLDVFFSWESLKWAYSPQGRPPSAKKPLVYNVLCKHGLPIDEDFLDELAKQSELEGFENE